MSFSSLEATFVPLEIVFPKPQKVSGLPTTSDQLEALLSATQAACEKAAQETYQTSLAAMRLQAHEYIIRMLEQATLARHRMFGASSEQLSAQSRLFDEAEVLAQLNPEAQDQAIIAPALLISMQS
jgi:putative NADH-flavin reductase